MSLIGALPEASARDCSTIDLRDAQPALGDWLRTPRYQQDLSWCYAYAAADLISFRLGQPISAVDLAMVYDFEINRDFFAKFIRDPFFRDEIYSDGLPRKAILYGGEYGVCPESDIPSNLDLEELEDLQVCVDRVRGGDMAPEQTLDSTVKSVSCRDLSKAVFPKLDPMDLMRIAQATLDGNINVILFEATQAACKSGRVLAPSRLEAVARSPDPFEPLTAIFDEIDRQLETRNLVAIAYDPGEILAPRYRRDWSKRLFEFHVSVIEARQFRDGQCKYLVRNSWGKTCKFYNERIRQDCVPNEGAYWISDQELAPLLVNITYIL